MKDNRESYDCWALMSKDGRWIEEEADSFGNPVLATRIWEAKLWPTRESAEFDAAVINMNYVGNHSSIEVKPIAVRATYEAEIDNTYYI